MGKVKKSVKPVETKPLVLNKENKISKGKPSSKKTLKDQIRKNLGVKEPKKTSLKSEQKRLAAIVENSSVQVTKKSKSLQNQKTSAVETKKSSKGIKRKNSTAEDSPVAGKFVLLREKVATPEKQDTNNTKKFEHRFKIEENAVRSAFQGVQKLLEEAAKQHKKLFEDDQPIFLQITSVKVPKCPPRVARLSLKHSLFTNGGDVCFIAVDIPKIEPEEVKDHYEKLFASKGIKNIKTIMPLRELLTEYGEYELKRRLVELYDVFLVDGRISGRVSRSLGSIFYQKRKLPAPVKFQEKNLQRNIKKALLKTPLHIHPKGDTFIVQVGHSGMTEQQMITNFWSVAQGIDKEFPGHWDNVKSLHMKGSNTMSVPVYLNLISKNEITVPVIKPKRPKAFVAVSDELSTKYNQKVTVHPSGEVETEVLKKKQNSVENRSDDDIDDDNTSDEENDDDHGGVKQKEENDEENTETEDESEVEYTEDERKYLQLMQKQAKKNKNEKLVKEKKHKGSQNKKNKRAKPLRK